MCRTPSHFPNTSPRSTPHTSQPAATRCVYVTTRCVPTWHYLRYEPWGRRESRGQGAVAVGVEGGELLKARLQCGAVHMEERLQALANEKGVRTQNRRLQGPLTIAGTHHSVI